MPGGGSILGMITSYRDNRNMLRKRSFFKRTGKFEDSPGSTLDSSIGAISPKPISDEAKKKYQDIAKSINRRTRINTLFISIAALILFGIGVWWIILSLGAPPPPERNSDLPFFIDTKKEEFEFYLGDGDYWFKDGDMELAIREYKKALKLYPDNYSANLKLAKASLNYCMKDHSGCEEMIILLDRLVKKFPSNAQLYEMRATYLSSIGETERAAMDFEMYELISNGKK